MTFNEIYLLKKKDYVKYLEVPKELRFLFDESLELIDITDKKIFAVKHEEDKKKFQAWLNELDNAKWIANPNRSGGCYDPERAIMNALRNGEGEKFGF